MPVALGPAREAIVGICKDAAQQGLNQARPTSKIIHIETWFERVLKGSNFLSRSGLGVSTDRLLLARLFSENKIGDVG